MIKLLRVRSIKKGRHLSASFVFDGYGYGTKFHHTFSTNGRRNDLFVPATGGTFARIVLVGVDLDAQSARLEFHPSDRSLAIVYNTFTIGAKK